MLNQMKKSSSMQFNPRMAQPHGFPSTGMMSHSNSMGQQDVLSHAGSQAAPLPRLPNPPDRPLTPYLRFSKKMWATIPNEGGSISVMAKNIGQMWTQLSAEEKKPYVEAYEADKIVYQENMRQYEQQAEQHNNERKRLQMAESLNAKSVLMPTNDDNYDPTFDFRAVAQKRFNRNHSLMQDIFQEKVNLLHSVQELEFVTQKQLNFQVSQNAIRKKKLDVLEQEVNDKDDTFQSKVAKINQSCYDFHQKLEKVLDEQKKDMELNRDKYEKIIQDALNNFENDVAILPST